MQISSIISLFNSLEIYCFHSQSTVNICIAGLNHRAGYAPVRPSPRFNSPGIIASLIAGTATVRRTTMRDRLLIVVETH